MGAKPDEAGTRGLGVRVVDRGTRTGARFAVDVDGTLTLELDPLQTDRTHMATSCGSSTRMA